ncbi:MAG: phosphomannomutase/phosphoglucomutase [Deltaproteobacteria bacterium]|nr:phosphomannomutase/phosphoglucomutase [Deltaproteobacteria bacterium]
MNPEVFREYDVRGIVDRDLNPEFVYLLGRSIGTYAVRRSVRTMTLGGDCRLSSPAYREAIGRGLADSGIEVLDIGLCATPMLYFSIRHFQTGGGVMVTGSHNPPDFNGFKICIGPDTIYGEDIQSLRGIIERQDFVSGKGSIRTAAIASAYEDDLLERIHIHPGRRIVLDGGNGVGGHFALPLLKRFGCQVTCLFCTPDGRFPNHFPDPTLPENLTELIRVVAAEKADIGIAYDGDADRIGVVTDRGEILWGDELLLLFSRFILKANPGAAVIGEVKCSQKLYDDIAAQGGRPIMWKAGHSLIKGKMKEEKALLAGEMSGHIFFADRYYGYDDAIYASLRLLEILSETGMQIGELLADVPKTFTTPEIRVDCPDRIKFQIVEAVREHFRKTHDIIAIDGVRIPFGDGWGLIRASNTQPVLVLRFEAATPERLAAIRSTVEEVLDTIMRRGSHEQWIGK